LEYVWAITKVIFSYTGSPGEKIPQKVLGGLLFFDSHCRRPLSASLVSEQCGSLLHQHLSNTAANMQFAKCAD